MFWIVLTTPKALQLCSIITSEPNLEVLTQGRPIFLIYLKALSYANSLEQPTFFIFVREYSCFCAVNLGQVTSARAEPVDIFIAQGKRTPTALPCRDDRQTDRQTDNEWMLFPSIFGWERELQRKDFSNFTSRSAKDRNFLRRFCKHQRYYFLLSAGNCIFTRFLEQLAGTGSCADWAFG